MNCELKVVHFHTETFSNELLEEKFLCASEIQKHELQTMNFEPHILKTDIDFCMLYQSSIGY